MDNIIGYAEHDNFKQSQESRVTKAHTRRKKSNLYDIERERQTGSTIHLLKPNGEFPQELEGFKILKLSKIPMYKVSLFTHYDKKRF